MSKQHIDEDYEFDDEFEYEDDHVKVRRFKKDLEKPIKKKKYDRETIQDDEYDRR